MLTQNILVAKNNVILAGDVCKYIDYYELYEGNEIRKFFPKISVWSDPRYDLLTFPYGDFPSEFIVNLPRRDGNKHRLRVRDWNTGKTNEKKRGTCEDNFLDPAQGRVTGLNDIWRDHPVPKEFAIALDAIPDEYAREEAFKFFGYVKSYSSKIDKENQIPYELIVDFEPEESITKAIIGKIKAGSIKFFGSNKIFQIADIGYLSVVLKDRHPFLSIVLKSEMESEKETDKQSIGLIDLVIKDFKTAALKAIAQELEENKKEVIEEKIKIESEKDDLKIRLLELEKVNKNIKEEKIKIESEKDDLKSRLLELELELEKEIPKESEVTFIIRKDEMSKRLQIGDNYEIINKVEINVEQIGGFVGIKMFKRDGNDGHGLKEKIKECGICGNGSENIGKEKDLKFFERLLESSEPMYSLLLLPRASFPEEFLKLLPNLGEDVVVRDYNTGQKVYTHLDSRQYRITGLNPIWKRYPHLKTGNKIRVAIDPESREVIIDFDIGVKVL